MPFISAPHKQYKRIISLVPSQTELLYSLGLGEEVIGITKFCVHPAEWFRSKQRIGGTKTVKIDMVRLLQPDLILANKEENVQEQVEELASEFDLYMSDIADLPSALDMIQSVGILTGKTTEASKVIRDIEAAFNKLEPAPKPLKTAYLIWQNPFMTIGGDTFIHDMLRRCGLDNIFKELSRYPVVTIDDLKNARCELLLLSSEPFPFKQQHIEHIQSELPGVKIMLVDGEMFSWYGSRLLLAPEYFYSLTRDLR